MPAIRVLYDKGKSTEREGWLYIWDVQTDKDGYLQMFRVQHDNGTVVNLHSFRHHVPSLMELAVAVFGGGTSLRSAKGLMEDFNRRAGKEKWHGAAGAAGVVLGSVALLYSFLKSRPFDTEGYYDGEGNLWLPRLIYSKNADDYDPDVVLKPI
jgi:hypothetical protein